MKEQSPYPDFRIKVINFKGWEFKQITRFLWGKERSTHEKEQIVPVALLWCTTWANCSHLLFCKELREQFTHCHFFVKSKESKSLLCSLKKRLSKEGQEGFVHFWEPFAENTSELLILLFFKERWEQFAQGCSYVKSDRSKSLMVVLL